MTKHLITGVAGFIGSTLAETLLRSGLSVVGVDSLTDYYPVENKQKNLAALQEFSRFEYLNEDILAMSTELHQAVNDCSVIYHQAGQPGVRGSWSDGFDDYVERNVLATQKLLECIEDKPGTKFVYASSSSVYGNADSWPCTETAVPKPFSPYGVTKLAAEHLVTLYAENFGLNSVSLRYFTVYGPKQRPDMAFTRFINAAIHSDTITVYGDGEQIRDFTYVSDIVEANIRAGQTGGNGAIYNLSGGSHATVNEVLEILERVHGEPLKVERVAQQAGDVRRTGGDSTNAREQLGWEPQVAIADGIARQYAWQKANQRTMG
ncbi:NAD-dependent epimerase/dehydratase family protein [Rhodococcus sp. 852002-51564_SCH6189132-a]|uniref:NAD-dependent epimerase/dehydratase family protein n=1 Tax=Rhodococcus sp. 852002-51564_SCH6189132-a TaxID=1834103 RepID=UPI0009ECF095|nr:GDP-mannose 4,6-dehydratase [Rhodococcus sp. 852002-51564_SCH6189132-a]